MANSTRAANRKAMQAVSHTSENSIATLYMVQIKIIKILLLLLLSVVFFIYCCVL